MAEINKKLQEIKCNSCGKLLLEGQFIGVVRKQCKCGVMNTVVIEDKKSANRCVLKIELAA